MGVNTVHLFIFFISPSGNFHNYSEFGFTDKVQIRALKGIIIQRKSEIMAAYIELFFVYMAQVIRSKINRPEALLLDRKKGERRYTGYFTINIELLAYTSLLLRLCYPKKYRKKEKCLSDIITNSVHICGMRQSYDVMNI